MDDLQQEILSQLPNTDDYLIGFADMHDLLKPHYNYRYAVVMGKKMDSEVMDSIESGPNIAYYNLYHRVNDELNCIAKNMASVFTRKGIQSQAIPATVHDGDFDDDYSKTLRLRYSHKMAATRSGIGWIGKTDLLISHRYGPRVRLASILTNYQFNETGVPIDESNCGTCQICVDQCPAHAANGKLWNVSIDRNDFYDAFKCQSMCRELSMRHIQKEISLCGICISVCPIGKKAKWQHVFLGHADSIPSGCIPRRLRRVRHSGGSRNPEDRTGFRIKCGMTEFKVFDTPLLAAG